MKAAVVIASLTTLAAAQSLGVADLPTCAVTCALNAIGTTGCSATDLHCVCSATSFLAGVQSCIATACSAADQAKTIQVAQSLCSGAGVTLSIPSTGGATTSASSASSSAAAATTTSSSAAAVTTSSTSTYSMSTAATNSTSTTSSKASSSSSAPTTAVTAGAATLMQAGTFLLGAAGVALAAAL